jgi:hypothetical protein
MEGLCIREYPIIMLAKGRYMLFVALIRKICRAERGKTPVVVFKFLDQRAREKQRAMELVASEFVESVVEWYESGEECNNRCVVACWSAAFLCACHLVAAMISASARRKLNALVARPRKSLHRTRAFRRANGNARREHPCPRRISDVWASVPS